MREVNEGGMKLFDGSDSREERTAIPGDTWWPQTVSLLEVGTVPRLERDVWSVVKRQRQARDE